MRAAWTIGLALVTTVAMPWPVGAQTPGEVFRKVTPSVVVIRAKGSEVTARGESRFNETGSGVLVTTDGKIMTAAHVVHSMNEITVEFLGGETLAARVIASEPAADLSLIQIDRVPTSARVAKMANSDTVRVGDPVYIVGALYGRECLARALGELYSGGWLTAPDAEEAAHQVLFQNAARVYGVE